MDIKIREKIMLILAILATISLALSFSFAASGLQKQNTEGIISGTMPLLAVSTGNGNETRGGLAYLDLKIINGTGAVYVHAEPFTRVDTQATTRFAKQYACSVTEIDCSQYDFLYSIRSEAPIVGGPSAGAAMTALTITLLEGKSFPKGVSITGSISSGGIIGNVGGIDEKIEAAARVGLNTVVVPTLSNYTAEENDRIRVVWANTVEEALIAIDPTYQFERIEDISVPEAYTNTMKDVAAALCNDNTMQYDEIINLNLPSNRRINLSLEMVKDLINESELAESQGLHYTQASHCFNARTRLHYLRLTSQMSSIPNNTIVNELLFDIMDMAQNRASVEYNNYIRNTKDDINSIQIKSIVKERYDESITRISEIKELLATNSANQINSLDDNLFEIGYTLARIDSMISWISFSGYEADSPLVNSASMRQLCNRKISEASERAEYVEYATGVRMIDITDAYTALATRNYDDCIYKASLHKARADMIMSRISTPTDKVPELITAKRDAAEHAIATQASSGVFPVMAYSYLEYAESLAEENPEVSLLYYENAIELSGLSSYFETSGNENEISSKINMTKTYLFFSFMGLALGFAISLIIIGVNGHRIRKDTEETTEFRSRKKNSLLKTNLRKKSIAKSGSSKNIKLKKISK